MSLHYITTRIFKSLCHSLVSFFKLIFTVVLFIFQFCHFLEKVDFNTNFQHISYIRKIYIFYYFVTTLMSHHFFTLTLACPYTSCNIFVYIYSYRQCAFEIITYL